MDRRSVQVVEWAGCLQGGPAGRIIVIAYAEVYPPPQTFRDVIPA